MRIEIKQQTYTKIQKVGPYSLCAVMTKQIKELGLVQGEKVYCCVEEIDGKKRIVVEGAEK